MVEEVPEHSRLQQGPRGLRKYSALRQEAGTSYLLITGLARLPLSMVPLAVLASVSAATGSLAVAGIASGAAAIGEGISAPLYGALSDRFGQRRVLVPVAIAQIVVLISFGLSVGHLSAPLIVLWSVAAGATMPQISAMSRARWMTLLPSTALSVGFAFEGILDELNFLIGPILVGIIAVAFGPTVTLAMPGVIGVIGVLAFALHPTERIVRQRIVAQVDPGGNTSHTEHTPTTTDVAVVQNNEPATEAMQDKSRRQGTQRVLFILVVISMLAMGVFFGGSQTALTAVAVERDVDGLGAMLYGLMALGSVICTMFMVYVPAHVPLGVRWLIAGLGLLIGTVGMTLTVDSLGLLMIVLVFAGCFQGPLLLTVFDGVATVTAAQSRGVTMALMTSCNVLGLAGGAALAGVLGEVGGAHACFWVVGAATVILAAAGAIVWRLPSPTPSRSVA